MPSASFTANSVTGSYKLSEKFTANKTKGTYSVTASFVDKNGVSHFTTFTLTNI